MKKELLLTFIKKYNLGNIITKSKWRYNATEKTLHARATADNRTFIVDVILNKFDSFGDTDSIICIGDTEKVKLMLSPFSDDISLKLNATSEKVLGFSVFDDSCESYCAAAHPSSIDPVPKNLQELPNYNVEIILDADFCQKFLKCKSALKDVDSIAIGMNADNKLEVVFGYLTNNSNCIRLMPKVNPEMAVIDKAVKFPVQNIVEAIKANVDAESGSMFINSIGVMKLFYKTENYISTYYQFNSN